MFKRNEWGPSLPSVVSCSVGLLDFIYCILVPIFFTTWNIHGDWDFYPCKSVLGTLLHDEITKVHF